MTTPTLEELLRRSVVKARKDRGFDAAVDAHRAELATTFPPAPKVVGSTPTNERAAALGWRIIEGGAT